MSKKELPLTLDFRAETPMPKWVNEVIEAHLAIETEDAKSAGSLGFMARAMVIATMPYKDPKQPVFERKNGDFKLRILAGYDGGIPYGIYPRLLLSWVVTEAVKTQSPVIELGDSLTGFLRDVLDIQRGGGKRGTGTRVNDQMKRLFGSLISASYNGASTSLNERAPGRGFVLKNVLIADELQVDDKAIEEGIDGVEGEEGIWTPQTPHEAGSWKSTVRLSNNFYRECVERPVPIDLRAYKALRGSPLAMDIYTWLTYRLSYTERKTRPIRWEALMSQFGSGYTGPRAVSEFKRSFVGAFGLVQIVYPTAGIEIHDTGIILLPSPTHVPKQTALFD